MRPVDYQVENNNNFNEISRKEIFEKLENLAQENSKKDEMIDRLVEKIRVLEEKVFGANQAIDDNDEEKDINSTFSNPFAGVPCNFCDFISKSNGGLQVHMRAKHKENNEIVNSTNDPLEPEIEVVEEILIENNFKCDKFDFYAENDQALKEHKELEHESAEAISENICKCDKCDFYAENDQALQEHKALEHESDEAIT